MHRNGNECASVFERWHQIGTGRRKKGERETEQKRKTGKTYKLSSCGDFISLQRGTFPMAGLSGSAVNSVRTSEQKAMSDEEGLRELNPFKSPK